MTYTCYMCEETFKEDWTEEEAVAELKENFGDYAVEDCEVVCDDCYNEFMGIKEIIKMNELQKYLQETLSYYEYDDDIGLDKFQNIRPRIFCNDGESVSIQAGEYLYSTPRSDGCNYYSHIEAGFPSVIPPLSWKEYAERWRIGFYESLKRFLKVLFDKYPTMKRIYWKQLWNPMPTQTVYAYMPVEIAFQFIDIHGGIDWDKSLEDQ